jgi:uncharacterized membrane-anchored protein
VTSQEGVFRRESKYLKLIISTIAVIFFIAVYSICEYFYPYDGTKESDRGWWHLKTDLYLLLVAVWIFIASMPKQTDKSIRFIQKIITAIGIGYGIANFIDRRFIHDRKFGLNDLSIVLVAVFISTLDLNKIIKNAISNL